LVVEGNSGVGAVAVIGCWNGMVGTRRLHFQSPAYERDAGLWRICRAGSVSPASPSRFAIRTRVELRSVFGRSSLSSLRSDRFPLVSTHVRAAELPGITQPDVSDLVRGKLARFSMGRRERLLNALDMEVRIQVGPKPTDKERAGISVELMSSF
jgi:hypothetical protein